MKKEKLLLLVIILLSLALRITNLKTFPPFVDETVYFHWAKEVQKGDLFFTYVLDDRQPLFVWLLALLQMIIKDPLFLGRIISALCGVMSTVFVYLITRAVISARAALLAAYLYAICSFGVFYERMALYEGLSALLVIAALYFSILSFQNARYSDVLLGITLGLAYLTKKNLYLYAFLMPVIVFMYCALYKKEPVKRIIIKMASILLPLVLISLPLLVYKAKYPSIGTDKRFLDIDTIIRFPIGIWLKNAQFSFTELGYYFGPFWGILILISIFWSALSRKAAQMYLVFWVIIYFMTIIILARYFHLYVRYFFCLCPLLMILNASFFDYFIKQVERLKGKYWSLLLLVIVIGCISFDQLAKAQSFFVKPETARLKGRERHQHVSEWSSGFGTRDIIQFLNAQTTPFTLIVNGHDPVVYILNFFIDEEKRKYLKFILYKNQEVKDLLDLRIPGTSLTYVLINNTNHWLRQIDTNPDKLEVRLLKGGSPYIRRTLKYWRPGGESFVALIEISQPEKIANH